ncbi:CLOCK-interacting pacemaker isoform X2 [Channa argus]|uniref:CLOCK-interacting pacemaker isoform X2 n=1 Tax=Channa argus TaxID=215402 RepID=UPI00351FAE60
MPKERLCLSEHSPCAISSMNAKDKSNSTNLLAIRKGKDTDDSSGRGSHCSSEKDSGYSDGSDWQQTDVEDQRINRSQPRSSDSTKPSQQGQNQKLDRGNSGITTFTSTGQEVSPIYIVKQADMIQKRGHLLWRNGSTETSRSDAPRMILLHQPSLLPATMQLHKPLSHYSAAGKKINGTYLPILNSYPRIAPHPSKKLPDKSPLIEESQSLSKTVCSKHKTDGMPVTGSLPDLQLFKQPKLEVSAFGQSCSSLTRDSQPSSSSTASSSSCGSHFLSRLHSSSSFQAIKRLHKTGTTSTRHRRFLNTVEILRQSGLLDITLRTKELLRQSNATEQDISQLRQHTELLCQVAGSHSLNGITGLEHLYKAMAESNNYPNLKLQQNLQILTHSDAGTQSESFSTAVPNRALNAKNSDVSPAHLFTRKPNLNENCPVPQHSHSQQGGEFGASDKFPENVPFMPPDSSTD